MEDERQSQKKGFSFFFRYLTPYKKELLQLILGMITASILQLFMPFLTQSLVDTGIRDNNLIFISLILIAQLVVTVLYAVKEGIEGRVLNRKYEQNRFLGVAPHRKGKRRRYPRKTKKGKLQKHKYYYGYISDISRGRGAFTTPAAVSTPDTGRC